MSTQTGPSRYASGSVANMIRSLVVILGLVAVLVFTVARVSSVSQPAVDVEAAATGVARESGLPVERPVGLPEGWKATSVRYVRSTDGVMTWHAGYESPAGSYIAVEQAKDPTTAWVLAQTNRAPAGGTVTAGGRTWVTYDRSGKTQRSLLHRPTGSEKLTTLVTGTGTFAELEAFADHLQPVDVSSS